ncbi:MAG: acyl-protein synthetase [Candidatus Eremiobacterota bacterium]
MLSLADRLCRLEQPFALDEERERLFLDAMRQAYEHHRRHCPLFERFCPERDVRRLEDFPFVFVNVFKRYELLSVPRESVVLHVRSSGTSGQKSQTFFDQGSLDRAQAMLEGVFRDLGLANPEETAHYVLFAYDPAEVPDSGAAFTSTNWTRFTRRGEVVYALKPSRFDEEGTLAALRRLAATPVPVRIVGFPAFLHRLLARLDTPLGLAPGSWVLTGGGWKGQREIPRPEFMRLVSERLGVPPERQRDNYGMVEHGAPYVECPEHRFHVPVYCRALIRDPVSLAPVPTGEPGLLQLCTPFLASVPNLSLLTSDVAALEEGCPCGRTTASIRFLGRGGTRKHAGCALAAARLLE